MGDNELPCFAANGIRVAFDEANDSVENLGRGVEIAGNTHFGAVVAQSMGSGKAAFRRRRSSSSAWPEKGA
jgi:hypothetical protein